MQESVFYQDIVQETLERGRREGEQIGIKKGERRVVKLLQRLLYQFAVRSLQFAVYSSQLGKHRYS